MYMGVHISNCTYVWRVAGLVHFVFEESRYISRVYVVMLGGQQPLEIAFL